ncbi:class I SAM-dependent methyltransferase [Luteolibacter sp. AS25]|uniref:class I SAM-dependent methyltransferase n=1 Tax=Luteolibacter sp. AS25 TaxID=3135776 RepID=UPI00398A78D6
MSTSTQPRLHDPLGSPLLRGNNISGTVTITKTQHSTLPERIVLSLFKKFTLDGLALHYPDGRTAHFGEEGAPITARITLNDPDEFFKRATFYGNIGMGEAYTDGIWDTPDIAAVISWFALNMTALQGEDTDSSTLPGVNLLKAVNWFRHLKRSNTIETSRRNIAEHYDLGNEFYSLWLDETMTYSSAKFTAETKTLADAQTEKYDALCRKLQLSPEDHVLEIGCGWGGFSHHAAKNYGCKITAVTISEAQAAYARQRIEKAGLSHLVEIRIQDYRLIEGSFDKIASIEMLEAVGHAFHESFFAKCHEVLTPHGLLAIQYITVPDNRYKSLTKGVDWIQKVIFPGSLLLSVGRVNEVLNKTGNLFLNNLEDLGTDYARTLSAWHETFNSRLDEIKKLGFDEPFIRTWNYYLKYCEAGFNTRNISVVQALYTRPNNLEL